MGDDNFGFSKMDAISRSGGILTIWDRSVFFNTMTMGEEGYLVVVGS